MAITFADVVVHASIGFVSGNIGQPFRDFGLTVVAATLVSFTLTPMLASRLLNLSSRRGKRRAVAAAPAT